MVQPVRFHGFIVEPRAIACLPFQPTDHAELCCTTTSHVIAAFLEFHHGSATVAALPSSLLRCLKKFVRFFILGAFFRSMPFTVAQTADLGLATSTLTIFPSIFFMNISWSNPFAAFSYWAINAILGRVFCKLSIP